MTAARQSTAEALIGGWGPMGLPLWTRPLPEEPAHGVMMRLAEVNGFRTLRQVAFETGLSMTDLHRGRGLDRLAAVLHRPVEEIAASSFVLDGGEAPGTAGSAVMIVGHRLNFKRDYDCIRRRACPACLRESNHHRFWWDLSFVTSCHRHGLKLVDACPCGSGRKLSWMDARLHRGGCCDVGDLRTEPGEAVDPAILAADAYVAGRLGIGPAAPVPLLDELAVTDVIDVLDRVGGLERTGWTKAWPGARLAGQPPAGVRAAGYAVIAEGRVGEVLEVAYKGFLKAQPERTPTVTMAYGGFYLWYNQRGHLGFSKSLTEEIYAHASRTFRIDRRAARNKVVVVSEDTRAEMDRFDADRMTLSAAAKACDCHLLQVRRVAAVYELMRGKRIRGHAVLLDRADVETLAFIMRHRTSRGGATKALGTDARVVEDLIEHGVLRPVLRGKRDGGRTNEILRQDVEDLARDLLAACSRSTRAAGPEISLLQARLVVRLDLLWRAVATGEVGARYRRRGSFALRHVMLRERDVAKLVERHADAGARGDALLARPPFSHWRERVAELVGRSPVEVTKRSAFGGRRLCAAPERLNV